MPWRLAPVACATLCAVAACKKNKPPDERPAQAEKNQAQTIQAITWAIDDVAVELAAEQGSERDIDATGLARRIGAALRATDHFAGGDGPAAEGRRLERARFRAQITYGVIPEGTLGRPSAFVAVEGVLSPDDPAHLSLRDNVVTERPLDEGETGEAFAAALTDQIHRAVDEMVAGVIAKESLRSAGADQLRLALAGDADRIQWALEIIGRRELTGLAPPVRDLLTSSDKVVADAAIATAVALGDEAAVRVLTDGIDFQDHERMRVVIEASAAIGGNEARQFLEFVATGHEDDDIKSHASDALERLSKRR